MFDADAGLGLRYIRAMTDLAVPEDHAEWLDAALAHAQMTKAQLGREMAELLNTDPEATRKFLSKIGKERKKLTHEEFAAISAATNFPMPRVEPAPPNAVTSQMDDSGFNESGKLATVDLDLVRWAIQVAMMMAGSPEDQAAAYAEASIEAARKRAEKRARRPPDHPPSTPESDDR